MFDALSKFFTLGAPKEGSQTSKTTSSSSSSGSSLLATGATTITTPTSSSSSSQSHTSLIHHKANHTDTHLSPEDIIRRTENKRTKSHHQKSSRSSTFFSVLSNSVISSNKDKQAPSIQKDVLSEYYLKILIVGGPGVGKSSLIQRFLHHKFSSKYHPTIGPELHSIGLSQSKKILKKFQLPIRLQILDVPHAELRGFINHTNTANGASMNSSSTNGGTNPMSSSSLPNRHVLEHLLEDVSGVIIMFDITNPKSIQAVDQWRALFPPMASGNAGYSSCNVLLCAHKTDKSKHIIHPSSLDAYIRDSGYIGWHMTSAKNDSSIREMFDFLIDTMLKQLIRKYQGLPLEKVKLLYQKNIILPSLSSPGASHGMAISTRVHQRQSSFQSSNSSPTSSSQSCFSSDFQDFLPSSLPHGLMMLEDKLEHVPFVDTRLESFHYHARSRSGGNMNHGDTNASRGAQTDSNAQHSVLNPPTKVENPLTISQCIEMISQFKEEVKVFYHQIHSRLSEYYKTLAMEDQQKIQTQKLDFSSTPSSSSLPSSLPSSSPSTTPSISSPPKIQLLTCILAQCRQEESKLLERLQEITNTFLQSKGNDMLNVLSRNMPDDADVQVKKRLFAQLKRLFYCENIQKWTNLWFSMRSHTFLTKTVPQNNTSHEQVLNDLLEYCLSFQSRLYNSKQPLESGKHSVKPSGKHSEKQSSREQDKKREKEEKESRDHMNDKMKKDDENGDGITSSEIDPSLVEKYRFTYLSDSFEIDEETFVTLRKYQHHLPQIQEEIY